MEWISVNDRLPEIGERCLVVDYGPYITICQYRNDIIQQRGEKYIKVTGFQDEQDEQPSQVYPHHWMPLPEPPTSVQG